MVRNNRCFEDRECFLDKLKRFFLATLFSWTAAIVCNENSFHNLFVSISSTWWLLGVFCIYFLCTWTIPFTINKVTKVLLLFVENKVGITQTINLVRINLEKDQSLYFALHSEYLIQCAMATSQLCMTNECLAWICEATISCTGDKFFRLRTQENN